MWQAFASAIAQVANSAMSHDAADDARWAPQPSDLMSGGGGVFGMFDNSGWTVATSGGHASATAGDRGGMAGGMAQGGAVPAMAQATGAPGLLGGTVDNTTALVVVAVLVGAVLLARRKRA